MFELGEMDIGARNAAAVKAGLARSGVTVRAAETGGDRGRTMRLTVGEFTVTVKDGIVTLEGPGTVQQSREILAEVWRVEGVVSVRDRLTYPEGM